MFNQLSSKSGEINVRREPRSRKLIARDLTVHRDGQPIVHVESLDVEENSVSVFVGENGCGKSTLLSTFGLRLRTEFQGDLWIDGSDAGRRASEARLSALRRRIGQSPQRSPVQLDQTVDQNLEFAAVVRGGTGRVVTEAVRNMRKQFDLPGNMRASNLNGGRRALLSLAMSFCGLPDYSLIIADEPTAALSTETAAQLHGTLEFLREEFGHTLLIVSHDMHWLSHFRNAAWYVIRQGVLRSAKSPFQDVQQAIANGQSGAARQENARGHSAPKQKSQQERRKPTEVPLVPFPGTGRSNNMLPATGGESPWCDGSIVNDPRFRV